MPDGVGSLFSDEAATKTLAATLIISSVALLDLAAADLEQAVREKTPDPFALPAGLTGVIQSLSSEIERRTGYNRRIRC